MQTNQHEYGIKLKERVSVECRKRHVVAVHDVSRVLFWTCAIFIGA